MIVTCVHIQVKEDKIQEFIIATEENHRNSVLETGNLRFDLLQDAENPSKFMIYEAYVSDEAAAEHKSTAHYIKWRDIVANWMAEPRKGIKYQIIAPINKEAW
jgi:(4S)-4-hydroxy-5-phosphonooxypentane-2,3-dione isomerase